jgi:cytochrome b561
MIRFIMIAAALALAAPTASAVAQPVQKTATRTAAVAPAPAWTVDPSASRVSVGESTSGYGFNFDRWAAELRFDPANLAGSRAVVTIEMGSARTGDATNDATLREGWMNARQHPQAVFQTTSFRALGNNRYEAPGTLTMRGRSFPVTLTFTAAITGNQAVVTGETQLDRAAMGFNVDPRFEWVSRMVNVKVNLRAVRAG